MLVAWRFRHREHSFIQWFDPRAWVIFFLCFFFASLAFWDVRYLLFFLVIALFVFFTSGWRGMKYGVPSFLSSGSSFSSPS